jgi:hypothetical protein
MEREGGIKGGGGRRGGKEGGERQRLGAWKIFKFGAEQSLCPSLSVLHCEDGRGKQREGERRRVKDESKT